MFAYRSNNPKRRLFLRAGAFRILALALLWLVLTEGAVSALPYGLPVVAIAVGTSLWLHPPTGRTVSVLLLLRFVPRFVSLIVRGGIDAALRALRPSLPIDPDFATFARRDPTGASGIALAYTTSLQPGTIVVDIEDRAFRLHVIDRSAAFQTVMTKNEASLSAVFDEGRKDG